MSQHKKIQFSALIKPIIFLLLFLIINKLYKIYLKSNF